MNSKNFIDLKLIDNQQRDLVLVLPGGGYSRTSDREADPVANIFNNAGFHTAIYYYRENLLLYPELQKEGHEVIKYLNDLDSIKDIYLIGFSAGGHLAGILMTKFYEDIKRFSFAFNTEVLLSMSKWKNNTYDSLYERSPNSCRWVFAQMQYEKGDICKEEIDLFDKFCFLKSK